MGISAFRREVHRWLSSVLDTAWRDVESPGPSRLPTDTDPEGTIGARVVDAVEDALGPQPQITQISKGKGKTANIVRQEPLTNDQLDAMYGMGLSLLYRRGVAPQTGAIQPLAHVYADTLTQSAMVGATPKSRPPAKARPAAKAKAAVATRPLIQFVPATIPEEDGDEDGDGASDDAADQADDAADQADDAADQADDAADEAPTVAAQVVDLTQEPPTCAICLSSEGEEIGALQTFGTVCSHKFHMHCIMQWALVSGRGCPVCRQPLCIEGVTGTPPQPIRSNPLHTMQNSAAFREDLLRNTTVTQHFAFLESLGIVDRLPTPVGPGSVLIQREEAEAFAQLWYNNRRIQTSTFFSQFCSHAMLGPTSMPDYWVEARFSERSKTHSQQVTASWNSAFHGSNMSVLLSILKRRCLDTGPRGKVANRHGRKKFFGVFCHKHGTRKKAAHYLRYFQYTGFIAAPLLELKVHNQIACGDQWCCDPADVQIEAVWLHVVPITSVGLHTYYIAASPWQSSFEMRPSFGRITSRYAVEPGGGYIP